MIHKQTETIYIVMKGLIGYNDETMSILGYSIEKLNDKIDLCIKSKMSPDKAAESVLNLWCKANGFDIPKASHFEMTLMGFELKDLIWIHFEHPDIKITLADQNRLTFSQIENMVLKAKGL